MGSIVGKQLILLRKEDSCEGLIESNRIFRVDTLVRARPDVLGHNVETVPRLYHKVRPGADYSRSLALFRYARNSNIPFKSGLMLGLGEHPSEVRRVLEDLREEGCQLLTLGQYLQPSKAHLPVDRFVTPDEFAEWQEIALRMGFTGVASGPLVRSSYKARELYLHYSRLAHLPAP